MRGLPHCIQRPALQRIAAVLALSTAVAVEPAVCAADEQLSWSNIPRVVAFADVHGADAELTGLLQKAGVVDGNLRWSAGGTHVVSLGDLLDRGADSRKVMDLLMRLQGEAAAAGGQLHVVLGNHEAMNMLDDHRYTVAGEYASFAADESAAVRERERAAWLAANGPETGAAFDQRFPPGYFARRAALAPDGKYGRWLLSQPVAIAINDTLFMHGGPSKVLSGLTLEAINLRYRTALAEYLGAVAGLESAGLLHAGDDYRSRAALAAERLAALPPDDSAARMRLAEAVQRFAAANGNRLLFGDGDGPNWYRGPALCNECAEADVLYPILDGLGLKRLVIGHTVARNGRVVTRFDGRVVKLDAGMNRAAYAGGRAAALVLVAGKATVLYGDTAEPAAAIPPEPLYVAPDSVDDATVAAILAEGAVTVTGPRAPGSFQVSVDKDGRKVPAVFVAATRDAIRRELAAYRLDRALQLGIVPATVEREIQGQAGYLQARPPQWATQTEVQQQSLRTGGWCDLEPQFELVYAFDALAGNEGRTGDRLLYDTQEWRVLATGHDAAFGTGRAFPAYLKSHPPAPGPEFRRRLAALDGKALNEALQDVLSARERKAILERRDALLAPPAAAAARP
jgi:hypothetical protein